MDNTNKSKKYNSKSTHSTNTHSTSTSKTTYSTINNIIIIKETKYYKKKSVTNVKTMNIVQ